MLGALALHQCQRTFSAVKSGRDVLVDFLLRAYRKGSGLGRGGEWSVMDQAKRCAG